jgi:hypothetical protein
MLFEVAKLDRGVRQCQHNLLTMRTRDVCSLIRTHHDLDAGQICYVDPTYHVLGVLKTSLHTLSTNTAA